MWVVAFSFLAFGTFTTWRLIKDPIQGQTIWKGTCSQSSMQPYEMIMKIDKRKGNEITGTLEWPIVKCRTQFQGYIIDKNISFTESAVVEGRGIVVPTVYLGKVDKETIAGTWLHKEINSVASGEFRIIKSIANGADARQEEKKTNIRAAELTPAMKLLSDVSRKAFTDLSQANNGPRISVDVPVLRPDQTYSDELLKKAESGDSTAQRHLGSCYYRGLGIKKDITKAIELWEKAALQGDIKAQSNLGSLYFLDQKRYDKAYEWFKKASDSGDTYAMDKLGTLYNYGLGVAKDEKEGFRLHKKAAEQMDPFALYNLALDYETGRGTDKNMQMAIKVYSQAASAGSPEAQYDLGILYFDGKGVPQNNQKAFELFNMAAAQNHQKAKDMVPMLKILIKPQNTTDSYSAELARKAETGDVVAQRNLGVCYYQGRGVTQDYKKSVKWITKSAEQGDEQSKKMLKILQKKPKIFSEIINRLKPSADIDGTTFVQFGIVGLASYHFNLKKGSFINYENRPKEWKYDDGSALSDKVHFRDEKYDPKLKDFSAYVVFEKPLFGVRLVEYKLKFDDLLRKIVSGGIQTYDSCGNPIKVKSLLVTFGDDPNKDLVYKRYDYSSTNPQQNP